MRGMEKPGRARGEQDHAGREEVDEQAGWRSFLVVRT